MVYHELVHLLDSTKYFGPPREIWEFRQEQMVQQISRNRPQKGGVSVEQTAVKFYMAKEDGKKEIFNQESCCEDGDDQAITMQEKEQRNERILLRKPEILQIITSFINNINLSEGTRDSLKGLKKVVEGKSPESMAEALGFKYSWLGYGQKVYLRARSKVANEICLQGRGSKYYSFEQQIGHRKSNWFRPDEISSCVRLKELSNPQGIGAKCKYSCIMSQINCFFSIHCPQQFWGNGNNDENIMNKAHFVLCNSQRGKFHPRTNTMELRIDNIAEQIRNNLPILVSMNDVVLQQLVVLGLDAAGKPIYLGNDAEIYAKRNSVVNVNSSDVCKLIFFQMGKLCI